MYINKLYYLCVDTDHNEQVNDTVYKKIQYIYVTFLADDNGKYNIQDKSKIRSTSNVIILDPIDVNNFIPHKDVSHDVLIGWIKAKINETELQNINIANFNK